jgi:hypothetical protein
VKKLLILALVAAFSLASAIGCGSTPTTKPVDTTPKDTKPKDS